MATMNYSSSSCLSNPSGMAIGEGSSSATSSYEICTPEVKALHILSQNIQSLISVDNQADFSDAQITVGDHDVPVHRCILGVRSPFFRNLFSKKKTTIRSSSTTDSSSSTSTGEGLKYELKELLSEWNVGYEAFMIVLGYLYSGKLIEPPSGVCTCVDHECPHDACRPAIDFALELLYSAFVFQIPELVSLSQMNWIVEELLYKWYKKLDTSARGEVLINSKHQESYLMMGKQIPACEGLANIRNCCCAVFCWKTIHTIEHKRLNRSMFNVTASQHVHGRS